MADTGATLPGTAADDSSNGGDTGWGNENNIKAEDANFAEGSVGDDGGP